MAKLTDVFQLLAQDYASNTLTWLPTIFLGAALVWFTVCAVVLFVLDVRHHRLPNRWTGALFAGAVVLLLASTLTAAEDSALSGRWLSTVLGSVGYLLVMFVLHVVTRAGIGMGDVKLAAGLGLYTGFLGLELLIAGFVFAFLLGGFQALFLVVFRGANKTTRIAFGPAMLLGCTVAFLM